MRQYFFTGSYEPAGSPGICGFSYDHETHSLKKEFICDAVAHPSYLTVSRDWRHLYAVSETDNTGEVVSFSIDPMGKLHLLNRAPASGGQLCHIAVNSDKTYLAAAGFQSGTVDVYRLMVDGSIGCHIHSDLHTGHGPHPTRQECPHAHFVAFRPGMQNRLLAVDLGNDRIYQYEIRQFPERVELLGTIAIPAGHGPRHLVFHPTHPEIVYLVCEIEYRVHTLRLSADGGELLGTTNCMPPDFHGFGGAAAIRISADGTRLYVTNRILQPEPGLDCIAFFDLDAKTGLPGAPHYVKTGAFPRDMNLLEDHLAVACQFDNRLDILACSSKGISPEPIASCQVPSVCCITDAHECDSIGKLFFQRKGARLPSGAID